MSKKLMVGLVGVIALAGLLIVAGCTTSVVEDTTTTTAAGATTTTAEGATTTTAEGATTTTTTTSTTTTTEPPAGTAISGSITTEGEAAESITVLLSGASSAVATTDASGDYTFAGLDDGPYTVTPQSFAYSFVPSQGANVTLSGDNESADFNALPRVVFASDRDNVNVDVYITDMDGGNVERLTHSGSNMFPEISPDKTTVIYAHGSGSDTEILTVSLSDTSEVTNISEVSGSTGDSRPTYTPNGAKIVFSSTRDSQSERDIYIMNVDGTGAQQLTTNEADDDWPNISPDGTKICFHSSREGDADYEIYEMNIDGSNQTNLTNNDADDEHPDYLTNSKILFSSDRGGMDLFDIYTISSGSVEAITAYGIMGTMWPAASPHGTKITYTYDFMPLLMGQVDVYAQNPEYGATITSLTNSGLTFDFHSSY